MGAANVRLSFINFIALPITFGIGVDYPVNVYRRFEQDRRAGILAAMRGVGGAVILCSLTTSLGYLALLRAHNQAVRSLGAVAVLGEVSCLAAALLALPAAVAWAERRRRSRVSPETD
jgi:predicted RND superfamily exporter protein